MITMKVNTPNDASLFSGDAFVVLTMRGAFGFILVYASCEMDICSYLPVKTDADYADSL